LLKVTNKLFSYTNPYSAQAELRSNPPSSMRSLHCLFSVMMWSLSRPEACYWSLGNRNVSSYERINNGTKRTDMLVSMLVKTQCFFLSGV